MLRHCRNKNTIDFSLFCFLKAACGDPDETHTNYAEEKTQK